MRNHIVFVGEENKTNNELYQLLNWRFKVTDYDCVENLSLEELKKSMPAVVIVSMVGKKIDYHELFEYLKKECPEISVITISTREESEEYEAFYESEQFHRVLRPITGRRVLQICRAVMDGKTYTQEESSDQTEDSNEKQHILVVDDNAMVLRNIKGILEGKYSVAVAPSGFHEFVSVGKKMPDLILLDYEMPEMNGKEVMEKLQSDEELREIPIVFLTSADSKEIVMELLALKPAGYILKPVESQMLLERIEEIIGK